VTLSESAFAGEFCQNSARSGRHLLVAKIHLIRDETGKSRAVAWRRHPVFQNLFRHIIGNSSGAAFAQTRFTIMQNISVIPPHRRHPLFPENRLAQPLFLPRRPVGKRDGQSKLPRTIQLLVHRKRSRSAHFVAMAEVVALEPIARNNGSVFLKEDDQWPGKRRRSEGIQKAQAAT
jgi:hypothetical protein